MSHPFPLNGRARFTHFPRVSRFFALLQLSSISSLVLWLVLRCLVIPFHAFPHVCVVVPGFGYSLIHSNESNQLRVPSEQPGNLASLISRHPHHNNQPCAKELQSRATQDVGGSRLSPVTTIASGILMQVPSNGE
jgi:hypothetical protein